MAFYRCINVNGGGGGTPEPFIASTGSQTIALPFYSDESIVVSFDLLQCDYKVEGVIIGDKFDYDGTILYTNGVTNNIRMTRALDIAYTAPKWKWSHIEMDFVNGTMSADGVEIFNSQEAHGHTQQFLFGLGGRLSWCGIKNFKVKKNGVLFLDFTPMKDSQTGEGYFHDEVSGNDYYGDSPLVYSENINGSTRTRLPSGNEYDTDSSPSYALTEYAIWRTFVKQAGTTHILVVIKGSAYPYKNTYLEIPIADLPTKTSSQDNYLTVYKYGNSDLNMALWEDDETVYVSWSDPAVPVDFYENV